MIKGINSAVAGMAPKMARLDVISNNLANIHTTGYKKDDIFLQMIRESDLALTNVKGEVDRMNITKMTDFAEGSLQQTSNPLDLAIQGSGFFAVETPQGVQFTRNGNFALGLDGSLVTSQGYHVLGNEGKIVFPDHHKLTRANILVAINGDISFNNESVAKLKVVDFQDISTLTKAGNSLFVADPSGLSGEYTVDLPTIRQGFIEESNVNGIVEMISMIELTRNFESSQKAVQAMDASIDKALEVGRF